MNQVSHQPKTSNMKKSMKLAIINCCSVVNKHIELEVLLHIQNFDLLVGTESHLDEIMSIATSNTNRVLYWDLLTSYQTLLLQSKFLN